MLQHNLCIVLSFLVASNNKQNASSVVQIVNTYTGKKKSVETISLRKANKFTNNYTQVTQLITLEWFK